MLVVFDSGGNLVKLNPENVYQGSNKANTVYLILPQPPTAVLEARFLLPNGIITKPIIVPVANETGYFGFKDENGNQLYLYAFSILGALTSFAGTVSCQITAKTQGTILGTYTFNFTVSEGIPPDEVEEIDSYDAIIDALESLNISITNNLEDLDEKITQLDEDTWKLANIELYEGNLNDLHGEGACIKVVNNASAPTSSGWYIVYVIADTYVNHTVQYAIGYNTVFTRIYNNVYEWTEWVRLANNGEISTLDTRITELANRLNDLVIGNQTDIFVLVEALPETGLTNKIYLVPIEDGENPNVFDEYIWVNNAWEYLGQSGLNIDLADYVKFTDYATKTVAGVVLKAEENEIDREAYNHYIDCYFLPYGVKRSLTNPPLRYSWTDEDKAAALETLGAVKQIQYDRTYNNLPSGTDAGVIGLIYMRDWQNNETAVIVSPSMETGRFSVPVRREDGNFYVTIPRLDFDCANKKYVDDNFVAKVSTTDSLKIRVYAINANGEQVIARANSAQDTDALIIRDGAGRAKVTDPNDAFDIVNLQTLERAINALKANAETWTFTLEDGSTVTKKVLVLPETT